MGSPQTLSQADRRIVALWAADCAERVIGLFEAEAPGDGRPREAIARTRAFARGELDVAEAIRGRFVNGEAARDVSAPAAVAAARAAGQAASIPHMGAHALGAAAYAAKAAGLGAPDRPQGGCTGPPRPAGGCQRGDPLAASPYVRGGQSRPAPAAAGRREFVRSP